MQILVQESGGPQDSAFLTNCQVMLISCPNGKSPQTREYTSIRAKGEVGALECVMTESFALPPPVSSDDLKEDEICYFSISSSVTYIWML